MKIFNKVCRDKDTLDEEIDTLCSINAEIGNCFGETDEVGDGLSAGDRLGKSRKGGVAGNKYLGLKTSVMS